VSAHAQVASAPFPLLSGKEAPLTLKLKDLDSSWRVFTASSSSYENILASAMSGGAGNRIFTKGDTVTVGTDVFLVTYKADPPDMASLFGGGGPPKPKPLTLNTILRLSLLNLHALSAMDGIRVFDLKEITAAPTPSPLQLFGQSAGATTAAEPALLKEGGTAPDFVVQDDKGTAVKLSDYHGKVVVLDFWSTWCGPCQESLPGTNALAAKYAAKGVVVLGVNVWDKKDAFHDWLPKHKALSSIKFAIDTHDQPQDVATKLYHVSGIPTQYVIDRKGKIVKSLVGYSEDESGLTSGIKAALSRG
jgi:thiol-disulfide isomerase/thioredoxin